MPNSRRPVSTRKKGNNWNNRRKNAESLVYQPLETRNLLCNNVSGTITGDVVWSEDEYCISGPLRIYETASLTIESDAIVRTNRHDYDLDVDGLLVINGAAFEGADHEIDVRDGGRIEANGVEFSGNRIALRNGSTGFIQNGDLLGSFHILNESGGVAISNNDFFATHPGYAIGEHVEDFYNNTYHAADPVFWIKDYVHSDVTLESNGNAFRYRIYGGGLHVRATASLTVEPGVEVQTDRHDYDLDVSGELIIDSASFTTADTEIDILDGGRIESTGSSFVGHRLLLRSGSTGWISDGDFLGSFNVTNESGGVSIDGNTFTASNPVFTDGDYVEEFYDNSFLSSETTFWIKWGIETDVELRAFGNVGKYRVYGGGISVAATGSLTIHPGVTVETDRHDYGHRSARPFVGRWGSIHNE